MVKDILREIKGRRLQFLAILLITTLGVGFFIGIRVTGHDMRLTADAYMQSADVLDLSVMNAYGIDKEMKEDLDTVLKAKGEETYSSDVYAANDTFDGVLKLFEYNASTERDITLEEGKLPSENNEVLIDSMLKEFYSLDLGDTLRIKNNDIFEEAELKIVGVGKSSLYLNKSRGHTSLGSGELNGFIYAKGLEHKEEIIPSLRYSFDDDVEIEDKISILDKSKDEILQKRFERLIEPQRKELEEATQSLKEAREAYDVEIARQEQILVSSEQQLAQAELDLQAGIAQLTFGIPTGGSLDDRLAFAKGSYEALYKITSESIENLKATITSIENETVKEELQKQLDTQILELSTMSHDFNQGYSKLEAGVKDYKEGLGQLEAGKVTLSSAKVSAEEEFLKNEKKIEDGYQELESADHGLLYVFERKDAIIGYTDFYNDSERIEAIGTIFPLIFFGVAILITLSTITQMVDESRNQLGVYKALGFTSFEASLKYVGFAFVAWIIGISLGILLGFFILPNVIYDAYRIMYETPDLISRVVLSYLWLPLIVSFMSSVGVAFIKATKVSRENAANLLRPPLPKSGQRILLERFPWLWDKFSFLYKVSFRNLFRNKTRFFMTVIGIAGCCGLLITGFGISHSVNSILDRQFNDIFLYDGIITYSSNENLDATLYDSYLDVYSDNVKVDGVDVSLVVEETLEDMDKYFAFLNAKGSDEIKVKDNFVVITEKLAETEGVDVGDSLTFTYDHKDYTVAVSAIIKNHAGHYLMMSKDIYEETIKKDYSPNVRYINGDLTSDESTLILKDSNVLNVTLAHSIEDSFRDQMKNFDVIIYVVVGAAFLLELIVLTNLISMNISEREKELATLKVLGFYPNELSAYILRENIMMTLLALIFGSIFGVFLHKFVILTAEIDMVMFNRDLNWQSIVVSLILTLVISLLVNFIMSRKSNRVDMNEALKTFDA